MTLLWGHTFNAFNHLTHYIKPVRILGVKLNCNFIYENLTIKTSIWKNFTKNINTYVVHLNIRSTIW